MTDGQKEEGGENGEGNVKIKEEKEIKTGIRSLRGDSNVRRSNEGREAGGDTVHRQVRERQIYLHRLPGRLSDQTVRVTARGRERDSETDTYRQAAREDDREGHRLTNIHRQTRERQTSGLSSGYAVIKRYLSKKDSFYDNLNPGGHIQTSAP